MITQTINLNLIPGAVPPRVNVTQYDEGSRTIVCNLYNGTSTFTPSAGTTAKVKGTKPDKHGFEYDATISGRTVEIDLTQQMSCVAGDVPCEVELTLNDEVLGTGTFVLRVKASALADDTDISETVLPDIIDAAQSSAASAAASAEAAQEAANSVSVEYTVSGNPISVSAFPTEASVSMTIAPTQEGSGTPSPDNVRPITGISTATVQTTDGETTNTASMELGETVYKGTVDFNAGTVTITEKMLTIDGDTELITLAAVNGAYTVVDDMERVNYWTDGECNQFTLLSTADDQTTNTGIRVGGTNTCIYLRYVYNVLPDVTDLASLKTYLASNPVTVTYPLATPTTLTLTPDTLTMLEGDQTVSGNGETVTLTYDGNVKQYIDTKVPDAPTTDGTYTLTCVVSGGVPTYSWT